MISRQKHIIKHKSCAVRGCQECNSAHFGTIMSEFDTMKGDLECNSGYCWTFVFELHTMKVVLEYNSGHVQLLS